MGTLAIGDVVLVAFPYSDLSNFKKRPALVVAHAEFNNLIVCQITSKAQTSKKAIKLTDSELKAGNLKLTSYIRPDKLTTLDTSIVQDKIGTVHAEKLNQVQESIKKLF